MDRRISDEEWKAYDNLKFVYENDYWRVYEEKGNNRVWARRKVALMTPMPVDYTEGGQSRKKKNYKL